MTQQNREQYKKNLYCNCKTQGFPMKQMLVPVLSYRLIFCLGRIIQLGRDGPLEITWSTQSSKQSQVAQRDTQSGLKSLQSKNCTASLGNLVLLFEHPHGVNIFPVSNQNFQSSNLLTFFPISRWQESGCIVSVLFHWEAEKSTTFFLLPPKLVRASALSTIRLYVVSSAGLALVCQVSPRPGSPKLVTRF